ncbi:MAG: hypothetical protein IT385_28140 [Deltaproteobacteria bacterium]|nr:hypothetical protein [Deltaproteobacteria bacterium]
MAITRVAVILVLASCASAPKTPDDLGRRVAAALREGDVHALDRLYWAPSSAAEVCEPAVGERIARERLDARQPFIACRRGFPWADLSDVHVAGGLARKPRDKCGGRALVLEDILVTFEAEHGGGTERGRLVLEDALAVGDRVHLAGDLACTEVPDGFAECRALVARTTARASREIGSYAHELAGELLSGCESLDAGRRAALATCVDGARDLTAVDACHIASHALGPAPSGAEGGIPPVCERYLTTFERCVEQMPEDARGPARDAIQQMRSAWQSAPVEGMDAACRQAWEASSQSLSTVCPGAGFEEHLP